MPEEEKEKTLIGDVLDPDTRELRAYSMGARTMVRVVKAGITISKNGRPRLFGTCSETGCKISKFLPPFPPLSPPEGGAE